MAEKLDSVFNDRGAFRREVRLAAAQVAALGESELAFALAYELEPFSGVKAGEASVAWRELDASDLAVKVYDVAVVKAGRKRGKAVGGVSALVKPLVWLGVAAVALVAADAAYLAFNTARCRDEIGRRQPLQNELNRLNGEFSRLRGERNALADGREAVIRADREAAEMRGAYAELFTTLASTCGGRVVIKSIDSANEGGFELHGVAATAEDAAAVTAALERAVAAKGWRVKAGGMEAQGATTAFVCSFVYDGGTEGDEK